MRSCYDIIVVGAGPAGSTCALYAARSGLDVLLLDKETFPRDKVCGDAISGISFRFLQELDLQDEVEKAASNRSESLLLFAPDGSSAEIPFTPIGRSAEYYNIICRREVLDNILFQRAKQEVDTCEGFTVKSILRENDQVCGITGIDNENNEKELRAKVIIGADGYRSVVARDAGLFQLDSKNLGIATRAYYEGVSGMRDAIEVHCVDEVTPGYLWIFPLKDNMVNVGVGMVHEELLKRKINIRQAHIKATQSPRLCDRFQNATMQGTIRGWNLPLAHKNRKMVGDGVLLIGDAAGLVHPLSGEGISFSMLSGYLAAQLLAKVCQEDDFSAATLQAYQTRLWKEVGLEFRGAALIRKLWAWKPFVNFIVHKAHNNSAFNNGISQMIAGDLGPGALVNLLVYMRMLFR